MIKRFVRETLGCECPESVFDDIEIDAIEGDGTIPLGKVVIGRRLLIYLVQASSVDFVTRHLADLVSRGRQERDARGYHRFRLVLATPQADAVREAAQPLFQALADRDTRAHLHVIAPHQWPPLPGHG